MAGLGAPATADPTEDSDMSHIGRARIIGSLLSALRLVALAVLPALSACGGGGGGGGSGTGGGSTGQPTIIASVITFPTGAVPPGFVTGAHNSVAAVQVNAQTTGAPITTASVTVNGTSLSYVAADQLYEAELNVDPGVNIQVRVTVNGVAYTASHQNSSTYPTITAPAADANWSNQASNVVSWSGATPDSAAQFAIGVLDPNGGLIWPANGSFMAVPSSTTSITIDPNSVSTGSRLVLVGIVAVVAIPGAANGSGVVIGGFNFVPITVSVPVAAPQSVSTSPATVTVGIGKSSQLAATVTFTDSSTQDITAQADWSSSNTAIVTVSNTGVVTGVAGGAATVTAQYGGFSASTSVSVFQPNPSPPPPLSQAVTYQVDYAHSGRATVGGSGPIFPPTAHWATTLSGDRISYPVIADGKVFVTTNAPPNGEIYGTSLYAIDQLTGNNAWGPTPIPGTYSFSGIAYDHGTLFVVNFDGLLRTFDAATGTPGWFKQLPVTQVTSAPTAVNGIVYIPGYGGLSATDEANGNAIFTAPAGGDHSSPAVSADGVFAANPCNAQKVDPIVGTVLWYFSEACSGGGGKTVAYANNIAYVREMFDTATSAQVDLKLDAATGTQIGSFTANVIPAFSGTTGFFLSNGNLSAVDLAAGTTLWSFAGDGQLDSAPIVIDDSVVIGSLSGTVYALDVANGAVRWSGSAGAPIEAPDEQNAMLLTGLGAGNGYLVVPAGNVLNGWRVVP